MQLSDYLTNTRDLLRDDAQNFYSNAQLTRWVNRARKQVAKAGQCVRLLPPSTATITSIMVTQGGTGYLSAPTVTITPPDGQANLNIQATATASVSGGAVTAITVTNPGAGYVAQPTITITGGSGSGATASAALSAHVTTVVNREVYQIADLQAVVNMAYPGSGEILGVGSVAISQGTVKPLMNYQPWTIMQGFLRAYPNYRTWPTYWSLYGQGAIGSLYLFPIPSQVTQMDVDCLCSVLDLSPTQTVDLIPEPWTEAVYYWAAQLAYLFGQRPDDARNMVSLYETKMLEARGAVDLPRIPNPYGGA